MFFVFLVVIKFLFRRCSDPPSNEVLIPLLSVCFFVSPPFRPSRLSPPFKGDPGLKLMELIFESSKEDEETFRSPQSLGESQPSSNVEDVAGVEGVDGKVEDEEDEFFFVARLSS